jgi:hypothetical protein
VLLKKKFAKKKDKKLSTLEKLLRNEEVVRRYAQ